jgi:hypothetical protein
MKVSDFATELQEAVEALDRKFAECEIDPVEYAARREMMVAWLEISSETVGVAPEHSAATG